VVEKFEELVDNKYLIDGFRMPKVLDALDVEFDYIDSAMIAEVQMELW